MLLMKCPEESQIAGYKNSGTLSQKARKTWRTQRETGAAIRRVSPVRMTLFTVSHRASAVRSDRIGVV